MQTPNPASPLAAVSARVREALAARDLESLAETLASRARILAEFAAGATPGELAAAQADNAAIAEFLASEKTTLFAGVARSRSLQRALSQNLPVGDPRQRGTLA